MASQITAENVVRNLTFCTRFLLIVLARQSMVALGFIVCSLTQVTLSALGMFIYKIKIVKFVKMPCLSNLKFLYNCECILILVWCVLTNRKYQNPFNLILFLFSIIFYGGAVAA